MLNGVLYCFKSIKSAQGLKLIYPIQIPENLLRFRVKKRVGCKS